MIAKYTNPTAGREDRSERVQHILDLLIGLILYAEEWEEGLEYDMELKNLIRYLEEPNGHEEHQMVDDRRL